MTAFVLNVPFFLKKQNKNKQTHHTLHAEFLNVFILQISVKIIQQS